MTKETVILNCYLPIQRRNDLACPAKKYELKCIKFMVTFALLFFAKFNLAAEENCKCEACKLFVETFKHGMKKTEKQNFGGGNVDWEESNLGKFVKSEVRLVEILEYGCKKNNLDVSANLFNLDKNVEYKCERIVEENEEKIENWYFHKQSIYPDLYKWLCIDQLKYCCPNGTYGPQCTKCLGEIAPCSNRGICHVSLPH